MSITRNLSGIFHVFPRVQIPDFGCKVTVSGFFRCEVLSKVRILPRRSSSFANRHHVTLILLCMPRCGKDEFSLCTQLVRRVIFTIFHCFACCGQFLINECVLP